MRGRLVFLLEEPSMKGLLEVLLPRVFPGWIVGQHFLCVPHEGKSDLDRSIPRKLSAWNIPDDRFVIVRDNDNVDCLTLKARLTTACHLYGRPDTLVRLVCQELEAWYLGDLPALAEAFSSPKVQAPAVRKRFVDPDAWQKPSVEVKRLVPDFQKVSGARAMGQVLRPEGNSSKSFGVFLSGIRKVSEEMGWAQ